MITLMPASIREAASVGINGVRRSNALPSARSQIVGCVDTLDSIIGQGGKDSLQRCQQVIGVRYGKRHRRSNLENVVHRAIGAQ